MTNREEEALQIAEELLTDIELSRTGPHQILLKAGRLARLTGDESSSDWMRFEMKGYPNNELSREYMTRMGRWIDRGSQKGYWSSLAHLQAAAESQAAALGANRSVSLSGEYVSIASRELSAVISARASAIATYRGIIANVLGEVYEFASRNYYELLFSQLQAELFAKARSDTDGLLAPLAGDALKKIDSISERLRAGDGEAVSQAMVTCRRLIEAAANSLFPARDEPFVLGDEEMSVKADKVLNRLNAYMSANGAAKPRRVRLRWALGDIYERTSAGVHAEVTPDEARFLFLHSYVVLGELVGLSGPSAVERELGGA